MPAGRPPGARTIASRPAPYVTERLDEMARREDRPLSWAIERALIAGLEALGEELPETDKVHRVRMSVR